MTDRQTPAPRTLTVTEWIAATGRKPIELHYRHAKSAGWSRYVYLGSYKGRGRFYQHEMVKVQRIRSNGNLNRPENTRAELFLVVR